MNDTVSVSNSSRTPKPCMAVPAAALTSGVLAEESLAHPVRAAADTAADEADPSLPQNWSSVRKWLIVIVLSLMSLMVNMALVICTPASSAIAQQFKNHNSFLAVFFITAPNVGQVLSPLYIGPLSEYLGRVPVCHFFNFLFLIFTMVSGFGNSFGIIITFRLLAGASISSICLNPAITGDLFTIKKRGTAMSLTSLIPILGSAVGPIAGGYITQYLSWRWTFWLMAIATSCISIIMIFILKETYVPLLRRRALKNAGATEEKIRSRSNIGWNRGTVKALTLLIIRPFIILCSVRIAVVMALYLSLLFAYLSLLAATLATVFQDVYGFSESQSGLIYIALTIGTLTGALMCSFTLDYFLIRGLSNKSPGDDATPRPENRLIPIIPAMVAFPVGLLVYGWSLEKHVHWIVPTLATILCGFSLSSSTTPIMNYLVDIFGDRSASAIGAVLPLRYISGAFLPVAAPYMYSKLGYGWANTLLALVMLVTVPIPFLVIIRPQNMKAFTTVAT